MANPVYCALDVHDIPSAVSMAQRIKSHVGGLKLGLEFFLANGAHGYSAIANVGIPIFLDVKLHDIPNTVAGAIRSLLPLAPAYITVHTSGGAEMMKAAADAAAIGANRPRILGVTVLTSLDRDDLAAVGQATDTAAQVLRLAKLAKSSGLDGVICSSAEVPLLRRELGPDFVLMVPGIRPIWAAKGDQKRVMTPSEAIKAGATHLVIGRPITTADDPGEAAALIEREIA